jgi:predicted MFS family arabinose efflux permease
MTTVERRSVASLSLLYVFRMLGLFMVLPLLALYSEDLPGATPATVGLALGIYGLTQAVLQVPLGWLSDRINRKVVIILGLTLFALGSAVAAMAETMTGVILGRAMQGSGAIAGAVLALLADLTRVEQRTKAMAVVGISIGLSFAIALILGPAIASAAGLSGVFWFSAALAIVGMGVVLFIVPNPPAAVQEGGEDDSSGGTLKHSLFNGQLLRLNLGIFILHFVLMAGFLMIPGVLEEGAGVDRSEHWKIYLPILFLSLGGMVPLMGLAERRKKPSLAFFLGIATLALALGFLSLSPTGALIYFALWLFFIGFNYLEATLPSRVSKVASASSKGTAMGVYSTCQFLGAFSGGAMGGWILQTGGNQHLFVTALILALLWGALEVFSPPYADVPGEKAL